VVDLSKLKPKQRKILAALVEHRTIAAAAEACGLTSQAVYAQLHATPALRQAWAEACVESVESACQVLAAASLTAAVKLAEAVETGSPPTVNALKLFGMVLDRATEYLRHKKLAEQVDALKQLMRDRGIIPTDEPSPPPPPDTSGSAPSPGSCLAASDESEPPGP